MYVHGGELYYPAVLSELSLWYLQHKVQDYVGSLFFSRRWIARLQPDYSECSLQSSYLLNTLWERE